MAYRFKTVLVGLFAGVMVWHLGGCASMDGPMTAGDALLFLEGAQARGQMDLAVSGPPLAVGQKTAFFVGPEVTVTFSGSVDFAEATGENVETSKRQNIEMPDGKGAVEGG